MRAEMEAIGIRADEIEYVAVILHHPFRLSRRARGIEDVCQRIW